MEKLNSFINSKSFIHIALFAGCISLMFVGQERQFGIFAWIAPIFLLQFSRRAKALHMLFLFLPMIITGCVTQKTHNLFNEPLLGVINGIIYAIINFTIYFIDRVLHFKNKNFLSTLVFPSVYVVIEALVSSLLGTSGLLAQSQFAFTPFAQLSTITGIYGITFIINWFASITFWISENDFKTIFIKNGLIIFGVFFMIILGYGFTRISIQPEGVKNVKVATISGTFDLHELAKSEKEVLLKISEKPDMKIPSSFFSSDKEIDIQISNTRKAAESGAKIIVWSEAALFLNQNHVNRIIAEVKNISKEFNAYILIAFLEGNCTTALKPINNKSVLIDKEGTLKWEYKKSHPTPAEIPFINAGDAIIPTVDTEYGRLSNVICYDYDFPSMSIQANRKGVDIMLVPAYDWQGFAQMHSKMAQFETLQNGRLLIRANGNGINMITDNHGSVIAERSTFSSINKVLLSNLPLKTSSTIYSKIGNTFVILCIIYFSSSIVIRIISEFKKKKAD